VDFHEGSCASVQARNSQPVLEFEASRNIKVYSEQETGARTPERSGFLWDAREMMFREIMSKTLKETKRACKLFGQSGNGPNGKGR
jgi:hypothetical protein